MNEPKPSGAAEAMAGLALEVEEMKRRFIAIHGVTPKHVEIPVIHNSHMGHALFSAGDEVAGLIVELSSKHYGFGLRVGIWETEL